MWTEPAVTQICAPQGAAAPAAIVTTGASADGQWLALGRADGVVDIATAGTSNDAIGASVQTQLGLLAAVDLSDLSDGAARLAVMAAMAVPNIGRLLQVFDVPSAAPLLPQVAASGERIALSPDGQSLAFATGDPFTASTVLAIDVDSGATRLTVMGPFGLRPDRFSPDSGRLGVVTGDGIAAWRLSDQMLDASYPQGVSVTNAALSPDWSVVAGIRTSTQSFGVWRTADGVQILDRPNAFNSPGVAGFSRDGAVVGARLFVLHTHATDYSAIVLIDVATGQTLRVFGAVSSGAPASRQLQVGAGAARIYTLESPVVAVWCR
jgi:hypothetical protein